jgi:hypothetical protein
VRDNVVGGEREREKREREEGEKERPMRVSSFRRAGMSHVYALSSNPTDYDGTWWRS